MMDDDGETLKNNKQIFKLTPLFSRLSGAFDVTIEYTRKL